MRTHHSVMITVAVAVIATMLLPTPARGADAMISLADTFPPEKLAKILIERPVYRPFPILEFREGWAKLSPEIRALLVRNGEKALAEPLPQLPATLYLRYAREGNRGDFEGPYFNRRRRLHDLVLAECVEEKGRFRDALADNLWSILEESTWCVPAHVGSQRAGVGLPDVSEPIVDLFAAQTGSTVAWTIYLMGSALDRRVSMRLRERAVAEVDRRILTSYLNRDYGWMGFGAKSRADRPNNWNPWINGNVLTAALLLEPDRDRRVAIVHRVLRSLDRFLLPYPEDGGCDEGPSYWSRAGGSVFDNLDLLHSATGGKLDVFSQPLIQEIGRFIHRVHIADRWFVNIGDCPARLGIDRGVVFAYGRRIQDPQLRAMASHGATLDNVVGTSAGTDLGRALRNLFDVDAIVAESNAPLPLVRDAWLGSEDLQMMVARDRPGSTDGFFVAAWGGHNAQSHNHNDVGNVIVFLDGQPIFVDLGAPTYTAKTFSSRRYEIPAMQSDWHNVPTILGRAQGTGGKFGARQVNYQAADAFAQLDMDLTGAWPEEAQAKAWRRTIRLERGREVRITDAFQLGSTSTNTWLNFITPTEPREVEPGRLELAPAAGVTSENRVVAVLYDASKLRPRLENFEVNDGRLADVWGARMRRIRFEPLRPVAEDTWELKLQVQPRTR
jgi:hypothetical protein